jgi:hypothetical protein
MVLNIVIVYYVKIRKIPETAKQLSGIFITH